MIKATLHKKLAAASGDLFLEIDIRITKGQLISLYGPSGAGKTSLLRMLAGVLRPDFGHIEVDGQVWYDHQAKVLITPQRRNVAIVFQDFALFPNMTVRENIAYPLFRNQSASLVDDLVDFMELGELQHKYPFHLSGGQKQRVALARAVVRKPDLLLLDEPLSALDTELRFKMQDFILRVHQEFNLTTILVSHDMLEVLKLADSVFMLSEGKIIKSGPARDVLPKEQVRVMLSILEEKLK